MPWEFNCQYCNSRLRVPENTAGKRVRCPACGAEQTIPQPEEPIFPPLTEHQDAGSPPGFAPALDSGLEYGLPSPDAPLASPYQSPRAPGMRTSSLAAASDRVKAPAICLIVLSSICLVLLCLMALAFAVAFAVDADMSDNAVVQAILCFIQLPISIVMLVGSISMLRLRNRGLAITAAVLGAIPAISPCCLLGLPFGIWALTVLNDPQVQRAFR